MKLTSVLVVLVLKIVLTTTLIDAPQLALLSLEILLLLLRLSRLLLLLLLLQLYIQTRLHLLY